MRKILCTILGLWVCGLLAAARADSYGLADGTSVAGDIVTFNDNGVMFHMADDKYSDRIPWTKFSQEALKQFANNPKIKPLVEPFIEIPRSERPPKEEIKVQDVSRLDLPPQSSLLGAMFSSSVGLFIVVLIYLANLYAGFEIAVVRARPIGMVMGAAAVLPIVGPIIFLSLPLKMEDAPAEAQVQVETEKFAMPGQAHGEIKIAASSWQAPGAGQPQQAQVFQRGQFMFNRRFFETKFPGFFGVTRPAADKDLVLTVKATSGQFTVERISRIAANEVYLEIVQDGARQEIMMPFADIQEMQLKPKGA